ncbi:MAG: HEAT repeat domain-containing protein, partial [Verrucomicrobiota bacterium]
LETMRARLAKQIFVSRDLGFIPEAQAWDLSKGTTPWDMARGQVEAYRQGALVEAASLVGADDQEREILRNLRHDDPGVRYWGAVALSAMKTLSKPATKQLNKALKDPSVTVRIEAANALARHGVSKKSIQVLSTALEDPNMSAVLHAARAIELLGDTAKPALKAMKACDARMKEIRPPGTSPVVVDPEKDQAMFIGFSTEAFIKRFE